MHPKLEILEKLFLEAKNHSSPIENFFDELWPNAVALPRPEMRNLVERVSEFVKTDLPLQPKNIALAQLALAFVSYHESNFERSLPELALAQQLFAEMNDENGVQAAGVLIGSDYRSLGEFELAIKSLLDGYHQLSRTKEYKMFLFFSLYNLAEIYSETGQYDDALRFYDLMEKENFTKGSKNLLTRTKIGIGVVYHRQKKYALALDYLEQSLKLSEETNNLSDRARTITELGVYYYEMGDYAKAADYQKQALDIRQEMKIPNGAITNLVHLAEISAKQKNPDKAIELLKDALKIAEGIKVKAKVYQIHEMLSDIYQSNGDAATALFHFKAFYKIREEVQREDNQKKIKNLQLIFEAEQTKKENVIIKAQKREIETKNQQLQETIDELTLAKISKKARAITFVIAVALFIVEDSILHFALDLVSSDNYFISLAVKIAIIFSLSPINKAIEHRLLKKVIKKKRQQEISLPEADFKSSIV